MDRDFYLNPGLQFEQSIQRNLMKIMPEMNFSTTRGNSQLNWGKSDQNSQFESTLFSNQMLSSPVSPVSDSMISNNIRTNISSNSSPQKMNLPIMNQFVRENLPRIRNSISLDPNLPLIPVDPGFAEPAAKFSCFGSQSFNGMAINSTKTEFPVIKIDRKTSSPALKIDLFPVGFEENKNLEQTHMKMSKICSSGANSNEESSVSEQIPSEDLGVMNHKNTISRKRKVGSNTKKEEGTFDDSNSKKMKENVKAIEPPKDYIHVRARRGQATDSHSLAERVRREKISERMKLLQNLVPNCDKVMGKAVMLDEIINYVQSLQRQVEFLSMKLATVNPSFDFDTNNLFSQNVNHSNGNLSQQTSTFYQQNPQVLFNGSTPMTQPIHEFHETFPQFPEFGRDDLQSIVRMGFGENLNLDTAYFHTTHDQPSNMKIEL